MARTTNTDTLPYVNSRYELSMLAGQRVRDLNGGAEPIVKVPRDKQTVVALREIATGKLDIDNLRHEFVQSYKEAPVISDVEGAIESIAEDPALREIDAELESTFIGDNAMSESELQNELDGSVPTTDELDMDFVAEISADAQPDGE